MHATLAPDDPSAVEDPPGGPSKPTSTEVAGLVAALAVAAFAHLHRLAVTTPLLDELTYQASGLDAVRGTVTAPAQPYLARHLFGIAQLVLGEGLPSARLVSALASIATGVVLFSLGRRLSGWWAGVGALLLWSALPQATKAADGTTTMVKLGRSALLEPLMALFVLVALALWWRWARSGRTLDAALAGVALGAAVACKPTAGLLAPVLVVAGLLAPGTPPGRDRRARAGQVVVLGTVALAVLAASYVPLGRAAPDAVRFMVEFQTEEHAASGHQVILAGRVHPTAPWWAYGWWQWRSVGTPALVALLVGAVGAVALVRSRWAVGLLAASFLFPLAWFGLVADFGLPHYLHLWQPELVLLGAVGIAELLRRGGAARLAAGGAVALLVVAGVATLGEVATLEPQGYGAVGDLLADRPLDEEAVLVLGQTLVAGHELPGAQIVRRPDEATRPIGAVIVDPGTARRDPQPAVDAFLAAAGARFERIQVDHLVLHVRRSGPPP